MIYNNLIALLLYGSFVFYGIIGGSCLTLYRRKKINWVLALIGWGLGLWSFFLSVEMRNGFPTETFFFSPVFLIDWPFGSSIVKTLMLWGPVAAILPMVWGHYHCFKNAQNEKCSEPQKSRRGFILSVDRQNKIFEVIGRTIAVCSIVNFLIWINLPNEPSPGIILDFMLVALGVLIACLPYFVENLKIQEKLLAGLIMLVLTLVFGTYFDARLSNLIWPLPIFFMMATMLLRNRALLIGVSCLSLLFCIFYWISFPDFLLQTGSQFSLLKLIYYGVSIAITAYITYIYVYRLFDNRKQRQFMEMLAGVSSHFVSVSIADFDEKVANLLKQSGRIINADRASLAIMSAAAESPALNHLWIREDLTLEKDEKNPLFSDIDWCRQQLLESNLIHINTPNDLPAPATAAKESFRRHQIQSLIIIPIRSQETLLGFIGFDQINTRKSWQIGDLEHLLMLASILSDALVKLKNETKINQLAYTDTLTGLPNRTQFYQQLEALIKTAQKKDQQLGVIFIDLDGFKEVNDVLGHNWGDQLLTRIAGLLSKTTGQNDLLARFGGDEFLMMIPNVIGTFELKDVAERIMAVFRQPITVAGQEFYVSASCGIALFPDDGENIHTLIKNADLAMYAAKHNGKGQYVFVTETMKNQIQEKMYLVSSLGQALEKNQLELVYQPQVNADTGQVIGFEALMRWEHHQLGAISPAVFIPIAEETGLINHIGHWALQTACAQNKAWQDQGFEPVPMAVNLSIEQFRGDLENEVRDVLKKTGLKPQYLELEITESIAMKESRHVVNTLHRLKELGIKISIDDFGTEFSSMVRLKELPVDRLKIDMAFIRGIDVNPKDESIIAVMIQLAKRLGLKIIAEGVENDVQASFLKDEKCDEFQGYYYYKPLSPTEIVDSVYATHTRAMLKDTSNGSKPVDRTAAGLS